MKLNGWMTGSLAVLLLAIASCNGRSNQTATTDSPNSALTTEDGGAEQSSSTPFADVPESTSANAPSGPPTASQDLQPLPPPPLLPPTTATERLPEVNPGRADPFAPLVAAPRVVQSTTSAATPSAAPVPASPNLPPAPFATELLPVRPPTAVAPTPATPMPAAPASPSAAPSTAPPPTAPRTAPGLLAEMIEVSGVVEVGGRTNVIVKVPNERTSRYVGVGETLANGQVLVKRVESSLGGDPVVILEQNGTEIVRTVGSASMVSMDRL